MGFFSFLDREHTVAKPGYSRWLVPPAALCVHLCIGQAYALSVFNLPMTKLLGITASGADRRSADVPDDARLAASPHYRRSHEIDWAGNVTDGRN